MVAGILQQKAMLTVSIENPEVFLDTNIKGTAVLMDACRKYGIKRYQVSTDESLR